MFILADLPVEPNVIIVFAMVIFAAIKALLEKVQGQKAVPPSLEDDDEEYDDLYAEYEAELQRQRAELEIDLPAAPRPVTSPPPLQQAAPAPAPLVPQTPVRPKLSKAEKEALANLNLKGRPHPRRAPSSSTKARVKRNLASPTAARDALLLAEILGPPKALRNDEAS